MPYVAHSSVCTCQGLNDCRGWPQPLFTRERRRMDALRPSVFPLSCLSLSFFFYFTGSEQREGVQEEEGPAAQVRGSEHRLHGGTSGWLLPLLRVRIGLQVTRGECRMKYDFYSLLKRERSTVYPRPDLAGQDSLFSFVRIFTFCTLRATQVFANVGCLFSAAVMRRPCGGAVQRPSCCLEMFLCVGRGR